MAAATRCGAAAGLGQLARAQQCGLQRVELRDHVGQLGHDLLLILKGVHETLTGHAGGEQRDLLCRSECGGFAGKRLAGFAS